MLAQRKGKTKSERHHWWPECVSRHWANTDGKVHWLLPDGEIRIAPPKQFGCIGNGHYIKLGRKPGETTFWDQNFEPVFDNADYNFPSVISWLQSLTKKHISDAENFSDRFIPQSASDEEIAKLIECIISLAIRSPLHRESAVGPAEFIQGRGRLPEAERNTLIALNMRDSHQRLVSMSGTKGKFAVIYSPSREFIFGDGFFHNIRSPVQYQIPNTRMLVPITPEISVLHIKPRMYSSEPRLFTLVITAEEAETLNNVVQIYSRNTIFFRSEQPKIIPDYQCAEHKAYADRNNPVDILLSAIPRIHDDRSIFF